VADVRLATALRDRYVDTAAALAAGDVSVEHADEVRACLDSLPAEIDDETRLKAERHLLLKARVHDPLALHRLGQHLHSVLDPDGPEDVARAEADAHAARALWVQPYDDGGVCVRGRLDPETGALFLAALEPLTAARAADPDDSRTVAQRRADAFGELLRLASDRLDSAEPATAVPTIVVTLAYNELVSQTAGGALDTGIALTAQAARRLSCDAAVIPAVLGSRGELLDIGRKTRVIPSAIRRALAVRDGRCRFPGCARPPARCHAHHIQHWAEGGDTSLANLVLLCHHHHRVVHLDGWTVIPQQGSPPQFAAPPWAGLPPPPPPWPDS
jgi:hypothetical protein